MTTTRKAPRNARHTVLDALVHIMRDDIKALRAIASGEPDSKLSTELNDAVPHLRKRGWIRTCGCSDGDYIEITERGQKILDALA